MDKLHLIFPIALLAFIVLVFSEWFVCRREEPVALSGGSRSFGRRDSAVIIAISLCYSVAAFLNLGVTSSPQSFCRFDGRGEYALVELAEPRDVGSVVYFTGLHTGNYYLQFSVDGENWTDAGAMEQKYSELFRWKSFRAEEAGMGAKYVRLIADSELWLGEIALYDLYGEYIALTELSWPAGCDTLFDEQSTVPGDRDYLNSSYFDEIYHVRTAYEHMEGVEPYEISHPPLGKLLISLGIRIFGLCPFGWRFVGTFVGCMMLPLLYLLLKRLFGGVAVPSAVTVLMATDFMHFTQTRIATIDSYAVFFILLMYLFMYIYLQSDRGGRDWMLPLALSGVCFGLGAASKWTCIYAGGGLGVIWFVDRVERFLVAKKEERCGEYLRESVDNVLFCLGFFVAAPLLIYYLSYYPYGIAAGLEGPGMYLEREYLDIVLENQKFMFTYHSGVDAAHPYSSRWWQWIVDGRPILYFLEYYPDGTKSVIGAFVNPILCWGGLGAMLIMAYISFAEGDKKARFILIGYLAQLLPWVFVSRITFEYHYFPSTVFLLLAIGHVFDCIWRRSRNGRWLLWVFVGVSAVLFAAYYPVISGARVSAEYSDNFLGWFESWPF